MYARVFLFKTVTLFREETIRKCQREVKAEQSEAIGVAIPDAAAGGDWNGDTGNEKSEYLFFFKDNL